MIVKNTRELVDPKNFKMKVLAYGLSGVGKTCWAASAVEAGLKVGFIANETGEGKGLLSAANYPIDYVTPNTVKDLEEIYSGKVLADCQVLVWDSVSWAARTFLKDYALTIPRSQGNSPKRAMGIMELDDFRALGEITRQVINRLLNIDKHIIVLATEKHKEPSIETGRGQSLIGPDLPGEMIMASPAMFDFVLRMRIRPRLKNPNDAKTRYLERYFVTASEAEQGITKCRANSINKKPFLDTEEIVELGGKGSFPYVLEKVLKGYSEEFAAKSGRGSAVAVQV